MQGGPEFFIKPLMAIFEEFFEPFTLEMLSSTKKKFQSKIAR